MSKGNVQAKFRCLGIEKTWDNIEVVRLQAVHAGKNGVQSEENKAFWKASPNGEFTLRITNPESQGKMESSEYYYLDFREDVPGHMKDLGDQVLTVAMVVDYVGKYRSGQTEVRMNPCHGTWDAENKKTIPHPINGKIWLEWVNAEFKMSIDNPTACDKFSPGDYLWIELRKSPE